jgi:hypothetical protein
MHEHPQSCVSFCYHHPDHDVLRRLLLFPSAACSRLLDTPCGSAADLSHLSGETRAYDLEKDKLDTAMLRKTIINHKRLSVTS